MQLSKIIFAVLPALVLAEEGHTTTTCTSTSTLTKTMTLSQVHTVTSVHHNTTTTPTHTPTSVGTTSHFTSAPISTTTGGEEPPTVTDEPGAASALDASRVVIAGALGMAVFAMM